VGKLRKVNEDSYYIPDHDSKGIAGKVLVLADGMGGHNAGEVASDLAIRSIIEYLSSCCTEEDIASDPSLALQKAVGYANEQVVSLGKSNEQYNNMGSTVIAVMCVEDRWIICHVGDSRAYHISKNGIVQITRDHSLVEQLVEKGVMKKNSPEYIMQRHIITRAIGVDEIEMGDIYSVYPSKGDILLICSDGLSELVDDHEMLEICSEHSDLQKACEALEKLALDRGGIDNVTICIVMHDQSEVDHT